MAEEQSNGAKAGSNLEKILRAGLFAVTAELGPPQGADPEEIRRKARLLKCAGRASRRGCWRWRRGWSR